MARYCICSKCNASNARPSNIVPGPIELIRGEEVMMQPSWRLVHWSRAKFSNMSSIEIHDFEKLGHKLRVGVSFYLFTQENFLPTMPSNLSRLGLGGPYQYTIRYDIGRELKIYYKNIPPGNPPEVTVLLGCGGTITFDNQLSAIKFSVTDNKPTIPIH